MAAMAEVGVCGPVPDDDLTRMAMPGEFSADEVRAALMLTRRAADAQFWLVHDLVTRLPQVHAAMLAGMLAEPRARVLSEWTLQLSPEQARAVCEQLLARTPKLTTGQLIEQVKKLAIAVDPDWAQRRYEQAVAERKVVGYRNGDGSANLSGYNLPLDRVAAASGRIDALAKAAKRAGDSRILDQIRADLFLGMTDGTYTGLDDDAIITLLTAAPAPDTDDSGPRVVKVPATGVPRPMTCPSGWLAWGWGWNCGCGCPPCSAATSTPRSWRGGVICTPSWPATWLAPLAKPSGISRSPTPTGSWPTAASPAPAPPAPRPAPRPAGPLSSSKVPPWRYAPWPPTSPRWVAGRRGRRPGQPP